jgi:hypothetical protein
MSTVPDIDLYLNTVVKEGIVSNKGRLQFHMDTLFKGIDFTDKKVLDIGGGAGLYSFYAAFMGAESVVCLEPEIQGSSSDVIEEFNELMKNLERNNVELMPITLQAFEPEGETFEIILLHNSINHLDETACINFLWDTKSKSIYKEIAAKIYSLGVKGAKLIVCDCSRYNLFSLIRIRNPFAPTIEWHKHQAPEVWEDLFGEAGFVKPKIRWTSFDHLRNLGKVLTGNKFMAYFLRSHFCLTMERS